MRGRAIVATVLALGVTVVLVLGAWGLLSAALDGKPLSQEASSLVSGIVGTVVGALAVYLGGESVSYSGTPPALDPEPVPWLPGGALPGDPEPGPGTTPLDV